MSTVEPPPALTEQKRGPEDVWGRRAALAVALLGLAVVVVPALLHIGQVLGDDPFSPGTRTVIVTREVDGKVEKETTTSPEDQTVVDRALSSGGLLLLRLGVVAAASFLAGATVQRIMAMDFSGKFGPVELRRVSKAAAASSRTVAEVAGNLEGQMAVIQRTAALASDTARRVAGVDRRLSAEFAAGLEEQAAATKRAAKLATETAKRLRALESRVVDAPDP